MTNAELDNLLSGLAQLVFGVADGKMDFGERGVRFPKKRVVLFAVADGPHAEAIRDLLTSRASRVNEIRDGGKVNL